MILATIRTFKAMIGEKALQESHGEAPLTKPEAFALLGALLDSLIVAVEKMP